jgi:hypothetical protein
VVADARGVGPQEPDGVAGLDVRREEQDRGGRVAVADGDRGLEALGPVVGRHSDVEDGHVWTLAVDQLERARRVPSLPGDLEPLVDEEVREPRPEQDRIVGHDDA